MNAKYYQVMTTCPSETEAKRIARTLVEMRLAACAQVSGPVHSTYWWKGKLENGVEWFCVLKCQAKRYRELETVIKQMHSYTVPEILAVPVEMGNPEYLKWLEVETPPVVDDGGGPHTGNSSGIQ